MKRFTDFEESNEYIETFIESINSEINLTNTIFEFFGKDVQFTSKDKIKGKVEIHDPMASKDIVLDELKKVDKLESMINRKDKSHIFNKSESRENSPEKIAFNTFENKPDAFLGKNQEIMISEFERRRSHSVEFPNQMLQKVPLFKKMSKKVVHDDEYDEELFSSIADFDMRSEDNSEENKLQVILNPNSPNKSKEKDEIKEEKEEEEEEAEESKEKDEPSSNIISLEWGSNPKLNQGQKDRISSNYELILKFLNEDIKTWTKVFVNPDIQVYKTKLPKNPAVLIRASAKIKGISPQVVLNQIYDIKKRRSWDSVFNKIEVVEEYEDNIELVYFALKPPFGATSRDFLQVRAFRRDYPDKGSMMLQFFSVNNPKCLPCKGFIRAHTHISGYLITPLDGDNKSSHLSIITQCDVKGFVPKYIVNYIAARAPIDWINNLKKACSKECGVKK